MKIINSVPLLACWDIMETDKFKDPIIKDPITIFRNKFKYLKCIYSQFY